MRSAQSSVGFVKIDVIFLQQVADAARELVGGLARSRDDALEIDANITDLDAMLLRRAANRFHRFGGIQQRLGWDTSPVQADPARTIAFDYCNAHLELACANRRDVAARAGTDHHQVIA